MIQLKGIRKSFGLHSILERIDFDIPRGSFITLFGPNGCGKSTLMQILCGLIQPDHGQLVGAAQLRGHIGYVFQDYRRHLLPWLNVRENILFPLRLRRLSEKTCQKKLEALQAKVQAPIDLKQRIFNLSGGQAQLVSLMRALIIDPKLLILDEPFSAIDYTLTLYFRQKVMEIAHDFGLTVLFISHDLEEALQLGDQVIFLTRKPTRVARILEVPFPRPRSMELVGAPEFARLKLEALHTVQECTDLKHLYE